MYPSGVVEQIDIFEYKTMSMVNIQYVESVEPLSFNKSMERLDTSVVPY